jgi:hypothetical protein
LLAAWISVPDLTVQPNRQRYTVVQRDERGMTIR